MSRNLRRSISLIFVLFVALLVVLTSVMSSLPIAAQGDPTEPPCSQIAPPFEPFTDTPGPSPSPTITNTPCITATTNTTFTPSPIGTLTPTPTRTSAGFGILSVLPDDEFIDYPNFVANTDVLNLVEAAYIPPSDPILRLTTYNDLVNLEGAMWSQSKQTVVNGFETSFQFQISRPVNTGGDGFAFVIQNDDENAIGIGGCGQGYQGIQHSLIIEFDLYENSAGGYCAEVDDPSDNHVGVMYNGVRNHTDPDLVHDISKMTLDMKDGNVHTVTIRYDSVASTINVTIDGVVDWTADVDLSLTDIDVGGTAWVGFVGGTAEARQNHNILNWTFGPLSQIVATSTITPTQAPPTALTATPAMTATPSSFACSFNGTGKTVSVFRAPIEGNPMERYEVPLPTLQPSATVSVHVDGYAIDPITKHLWLHLNGLGATGKFWDGQETTWSWVLVTTPGELSLESGAILVPSSYPAVFHPLKFDPKTDNPVVDISDCISASFNRTGQYQLPTPSWQLPNAFSWIPLSLDSICQNSGGVGSSNPQIRGYGLHDNNLYKQFPLGYHAGIDLFGYTPVKDGRMTSVYSIADNGIVVGIGKNEEYSTSAANWGSSHDLILDHVPAYTVIVRYGYLYVLYGHLVKVDPEIYVGSAVGLHQRLGEIGTYNGSVTHLHLEIRHPGEAFPKGVLGTENDTKNGNPYGILKMGGSQIKSSYDIAQFFVNSPGILIQDYDSGGSTTTIMGFGSNIENGTEINFGDYCKIKYLLTIPSAKLPTLTPTLLPSLSPSPTPSLAPSPTLVIDKFRIDTTLHGTDVSIRSFKISQGSLEQGVDPATPPTPDSYEN